MEKQNSKFRWAVFAAVLFSYLFIVSQRTAPGLISDQIMKEFHLSAAFIGLLASIQFLAYAGLQIPIGILSDRFGPNTFLIFGTLLDGLGTILYSLAPGENVLLLSRMLVGIGDAAIWINLVLIFSKWFRAQEFVSLLGWAGMTGSMGFLVATVPFSFLIAAFGWRYSFLSVGIILCISGCMLYYVLIKKPNELFKADTAKEIKKPKQMEQREKTFSILSRLFSSRQAWAAFFCHFGVVGTYVGFIGSWAVPFGMEVYGMTRTSASQLVMIGLIGAIIGAPLTTFISSRIDSIKRPYLLVQIIVFLCWGVFFLLNGKPPFFLMVILFFLIGYGNGASTLTFAIVRKSFPIKEVGVVSGFANTGGFLSAVLLPSLFGNVLDHFHHESGNAGYHYGFFIAVLFSFVSVAGGLLIKEVRKEHAKGKTSAI